MAEPSRVNLKLRILKITGIVLGCIVGFILISSILLLTFLEPCAEKYLKRQVAEQTEGLYELKFEDISLNIFTRTALFENLHLLPDTSVHRQMIRDGTASRNTIEIKTPILKISSIGIIDALFVNRLNIGTVYLEQPDIVVYSDESAIEGEEHEVNDSLKDVINSIQIGEIKISDASFQNKILNENVVRHNIPTASIQINDFNIDFEDQNDQKNYFLMDDIQVRIMNYEYQAPDNLYNINISLLTYSLDNEEFFADSINLRADHEDNESLNPGEAYQTIYNINVPNLSISGIDVREAILSNQLLLDEISIENPVVDVLENPQILHVNDKIKLSKIFEDVSEHLNLIVVKHITLGNGNLKYQKKLGEIHLIHQLDNFNIQLQALRLDSGTFFNPEENFFMEEVYFAAQNYSFIPLQNPHSLTTAAIEWSSTANFLQIDSIHIQGDWQKNELLKHKNQAKEIIYNVDVPFFRLDHIDLINAFKTKKIVINNAILEQPTIDILLDKNVKVENAIDLQEIYGEISDFVSRLFIEEMTIQDASFTQHLRRKNNHIRKVQKLNHATLIVRGLVIDSVFIYQQKSKLPLETIALVAHNYTYWTPDNIHEITLDRVQFSSWKQELTANAIKIEYDLQANDKFKPAGDAQRNLYNIYANRFSILGLNLIEAVNSGRLDVDQIVLNNPELNILLDRNVSPAQAEIDQGDILDDLFSILNPVKINSLKLEGGTFKFREKRDEIIRTHLLEHASATVIDLFLTSDNVSELEDELPFDDIILIAKDYNYRSPDEIYNIRLNSLLYSSSQQVLTASFIDVSSDKAENDRIKKENIEYANRNLIDISADKFQMSGFDLVHSYETGEFIIGELIIEEPELILLQDKNVPAEKENNFAEENNEVLEQVADVVEIFRVEHLQINDGMLQLNTLVDTVSSSQNIAHVSLSIDQLRLASLEANDPLEMFEVADLEVVVRDYKFILPDSLYVLQTAEVRSSLYERSLQVDELRLIPLFKIEEYHDRLEYVDDRFDIHVSDIKLDDIDLGSFFENQDIIVENALIQNAKIDIYRDERLERDPDRRPPTLQKMLRKVDNYLKVDTIKIEDAEINFSSIPPDGEEPVVLLLESIFMEITNLTNDSAILMNDNIAAVQAQSHLMGEGKLELSMQIHLTHPEDLYTYEGSLETMDIKELNPILENLLPVSIADGLIQKVEFSVVATEHVAEGNMHFYYDDLELKLVDKDKPENPGFWIRAGTWLVNNFMIKSHNPTNRGRFREGDIAVERDYERSVFNHMGGAMVDGISSSIMTPFVEKVVNVFVGD